MKRTKANPIIIIAITLGISILFAIGLYRLHFDTDIVKSLPESDPIINDARQVITNHPLQNRIVIDVGCSRKDADLLVDTALFIESELIASKLFNSVGIDQFNNIFPQLILYITNNLPIMFTQQDLTKKIQPKLDPKEIQKTFTHNFEQLLQFQGIGQGNLLSQDPLGFKNTILSRFSALTPSREVQIYRKHLLTADSHHLLIIAEPNSSGSNTRASQKIVELINNLKIKISEKFQTDDSVFKLTPVGSFRAALDNEQQVRNDTERAIFFATTGIILLLLISFPRPFIGLLSLVPALAGTMIALFVYSLIYDSISILAIGFGGAIISITIDHGIAYLLFLDRPEETTGREASRKIHSIGFIAMLTTACAFLSLHISGFPILIQIGQFTAFGVLFSFLFVHTIFPLFFPKMPAAQMKRPVLLKKLIKKLTYLNHKYVIISACILSCVMIFFAKPVFLVDLNHLNSLSPETIAAEKLIKNNWGDIFTRTIFMVEGKSIQELQAKGDQLATMLLADEKKGIILQSFVPSFIFPGEQRLKQNIEAWQNFWDSKKILKLQKSITAIASQFGFTHTAFNPFFSSLKRVPDYKNNVIPQEYFPLFNITKSINKTTRGNTTNWLQFYSLQPGTAYNYEDFFHRYSKSGLVKVFDPKLFTKRLGTLLSETFIKMAIIIGTTVVFLLLLFFLDWKVTLIALVPIFFAIICTFGTLKLINHPIDIPGLIISIVILGMGVDYSLFFVRSYQRYMDNSHPNILLIRMAVFLASISTIIGFGVLIFADHPLLRSAGIITTIGIGYSLAGTFIFLPPLLEIFIQQPEIAKNPVVTGSKQHVKRVLERYRNLEVYSRMFARFKLKFDPMFPGLADYVSSPKIIYDIGSGFGVPATWLLEIFPCAKYYGIEPDPDRARIASFAIGDRGKIENISAPEIPASAGSADTILMLDMIHYIDDQCLSKTLRRLYEKTDVSGTLIMRTTLFSEKRYPWERWIEQLRLFVTNKPAYFRKYDSIRQILSETGFSIITKKPAAPKREETWIIAKPKIQ